MKHRHAIFLVLLAAPLVAPLAATDKPSVDELVAAHVAALGGDALAEVTSLELSGIYDFNGIEMQFTLSRRAPDFYRFELITDIGPFVIAYDGETAWEMGGRRNPEPHALEDSAQLGMREEEVDFWSPLIGYAEKGRKLEYVGPADVDGTPAHHLRLTYPSGNVQNLYLGTADHLLIERTTPRVRGDSGYTRTWWFFEYAEHGGVQVPVSWEREDRQHVRAWNVEEVKINPELDPALFRMPETATE